MKTLHFIPLVKRSACAAREVAACRRVDVLSFTALRLHGGVAAKYHNNGFIQWRLLWEPDSALFKNIIIKQEIIQSDMQYAIFIIPRFHWSF